MKDRAGTGVKVIAAVGAQVRATLSEPVKYRVYTALAAIVTHTKTNFHDVIQASLIGPEFCKELLDSELAGHGNASFRCAQSVMIRMPASRRYCSNL